MTTFTTEDRIKVQEGLQTQFQTLYGALAYETPYRDVSSENSYADSYGLLHAKEPLEQYQESHIEQKK
jgi:hypothetical protein